MEAFTVKVSAGSSRTRLRASWGGGRERDCRDKQTRTVADGVPRSCGRTVSESGDFDRFVRFHAPSLPLKPSLKPELSPKRPAPPPLPLPLSRLMWHSLSLYRPGGEPNGSWRSWGGEAAETPTAPTTSATGYGEPGGSRGGPGWGHPPEKKAAVQVVVSRRTRPTWSSG